MRAGVGRRRRAAGATQAMAVPTSTAADGTRTTSAAIFISQRLELLAQELRRPADHQPGDEDGDDREHQHAVEPRSHAAERDLAESA